MDIFPPYESVIHFRSKGARRQVQGGALALPWIFLFMQFIAEHYSRIEFDTETPLDSFLQSTTAGAGVP